MKIAIVTGASSGMGREAIIQMADRFSGLGEIWAIARREDRLLELKEQVPVPLRIFPLDLCDPQSFVELQKALEQEKPEVKVLINSAGFGKIGVVGSLPLRDETGMVRLNCEALCGVTHVVLPFMPDHSRILQFASSAAFLPQPDFAIYAASKSFVLSYSRALAVELADRDIAVTAVCPGPVKTEFFDIAEQTGEVPLYKQLAMASAKRVVKKALRDSMMGKTMSVYGPLMNLFYVMAKITPHSFVLHMMKRLKLV
ncbi:MAG: SDR family NAD(P)-dependent oxidoreductase [Lachnospiraceae bacterium]|nr:SDR family NAD(P)-dependent oxidoreductase [Lachnospiraceae bacterium]